MILDANNGKILIDNKSEDAPYVADGMVYGNIFLQGGYKRMEARNADNDKLIWRFDSINNYCQAAPAVDGDDVVFGAWDTKLRCLDLNNGRLLWSWDNGKPQNMYSPGNVVPVITKDMVFIVTPDRYMTALDRKTGKRKRNQRHRPRPIHQCHLHLPHRRHHLPHRTSITDQLRFILIDLSSGLESLCCRAVVEVTGETTL